MGNHQRTLTMVYGIFLMFIDLEYICRLNLWHSDGLNIRGEGNGGIEDGSFVFGLSSH